MNNSQCAVAAICAQRESGFGIECGAVSALADRNAANDLPVIRVHDHHHFVSAD